MALPLTSAERAEDRRKNSCMRIRFQCQEAGEFSFVDKPVKKDALFDLVDRALACNP